MSREHVSKKTSDSGVQTSSFSKMQQSSGHGKSLAAGSSYSSTTTTETEVSQYLPVGDKWREIQGEKNWEGLLEPRLDLLLRSELIRYGEFCQSTYDVFDSDVQSKFRGSCRFQKKDLLEMAQILDSGYDVKQFIFSTAGTGHCPLPGCLGTYADMLQPCCLKCIAECCNCCFSECICPPSWPSTNWNGYVAITNDTGMNRLGRYEILVVWRGTIMGEEWVNNFQDYLRDFVHTERIPSGSDPRDDLPATREAPSCLLGCLEGCQNCFCVGGVAIEQGFLNLYTETNRDSPYVAKGVSAQQQVTQAVLKAVKELVAQHGKDVELSITVTGHSLGAALAVICGYDIAALGLNQPDNLPSDDALEWSTKKEPTDRVKAVLHSLESRWLISSAGTIPGKKVPITVFTYGGPRVGNNAFRDRLNMLQVKVLRVENENDIVPRVPGIISEIAYYLPCLKWLSQPILNCVNSLRWTYVHVGECLTIGSTKSPHLKDYQVNSMCFWRHKFTLAFHNLEARYLHVLTGDQGKEKFKRVIRRDPALVNKGSDQLLSPSKDYLIQTNWGQRKFKGLIRHQSDGTWVTFPRRRKDYPDNVDYKEVEAEYIKQANILD